MKIIIPMAGMGKRLRPHTLTVPKPLIPVAGKPIVFRLVEDIAVMCGETIEEVAFVVSRSFGEEVENSLLQIAEKIGSKGSIHYQDEPLGTAHAILCAASALDGHVVVAFADTLFYADFIIDKNQDGIIWTKKIEDPAQFGVVEVNEAGVVQKFWEKPKEWVSDEAIIGIYYFKDGEYLKAELQYLLDNDIKVKGEYQLTDALENMQKKGLQFKSATVTHWLDCGNKDATVDTNKTILEITNSHFIHESVVLTNCTIIPPCNIGEGVKITNSVVGPYSSIGDGSEVESSVVTNSIIMKGVKITGAVLYNSMAGNYSVITGKANELSLGDFSDINL